MKISMFHLMPYRDLPADFEQRYQSVWVDPPFFELADPAKVGQYYNWTLDELTHAAKAGFDGICVNEHHQNAYGFMPSPNLMGSALSRATNGLNCAVVQMGATLPTTIPPIRVAEEYGMLDCRLRECRSAHRWMPTSVMVLRRSSIGNVITRRTT
jgi:hypothetical protein